MISITCGAEEFSQGWRSEGAGEPARRERDGDALGEVRWSEN